ncbi:hypothetical protein H8S95_07335 [Pontibacter sp. KCTC 32443]|uniref:hypothetical protein n=1 Tax=Pontibacter TaxID=323449 RepID=UPI00164E23FD|nr:MULTISPECIES: hypothetical protein [Pontibacter]MBC5773871.1 hypothetical protein [Pontibacter sp. KCTC 32443]
MKLNITSKLLSLFVASALVLTSCGDKDDDAQPNTGTETACKVTSMDVETMFGSVGGNLEYNSNGKVSKAINAEDESTYTLFEYDNQNRLVREEEYELDELTAYTEYTYTNGNITKAEWFYADGEPNGHMTIKYDGSNRVIEVNEIYSEGFDGEGTETVSTTKHTYNNQGNVAKTVYLTDDVEEMTVTYESYDNKINYAAAMKGAFDPWSGTNKNNPLKATMTFIVEDEPQSMSATYSYVYNSNNLPTKITMTTPIGNFISNFTYQCN